MQTKWTPKRQVESPQQWTTQETILQEEVHQTTKDVLEEQMTKEKSTGEDCVRCTSLLTHRGWTKTLVVQEMWTQGQMDQLPSHGTT